MKKWESEKHKSWGMPAEEFKGHVATDGSLASGEQVVGQWCSWIMMKNWDPCTGMDGSMEAHSAAHHQEGGADGLLMLS